MNTSIEQKCLIGSEGKSWERLMERVDQNNKEGESRIGYLQRCLWRMRQENYLFITVWSVHASLWSLEYILVFLISQTSSDSSCLTVEAIPHL